MRILYLHQYFNLPTDSGGTRSYEMARRLVAAGHRVFMVTSDWHSKFPGRSRHVTDEAGIEVHWLPVPYYNQMTYPQRIQAFLQFAVSAARRGASISADVVFATSTPLTIALPGVYAAKKQKIPMVFEVRDLWPELPIAVGALKSGMIPLARWLERFAYKHSERIVALSPGMREGVVKTGFPTEKVTIIPNSSDIDLFRVSTEQSRDFRSSTAWLGDNPLVLYAGTLGRINGVSYLAEIAAEVKKIAPEIRFLVVGDGAEWEKVENRANELGVYKDNFFMMKSVSKEDIPVIFAASTLAVSLFVDLPQMWANSANKFFDGLAAGKPIAINYQGWQAELLQESKAGIVLAANDAASAAQKLAEFLDDQKRIKTAAQAAFQLAESQFNRDHLALQLETLLLEVVASGVEKRK